MFNPIKYVLAHYRSTDILELDFFMTEYFILLNDQGASLQWGVQTTTG